MQTPADTASPDLPPPDIDPRDPKGLDAVREYLAQLQAAGRHDEVLDQTTHILHALAEANSDLTHQLQALRKALYGRRTERLDPAQLALFAELLGEQAQPAPEAETPQDPSTSARAPQRRPGRNPLPEHLPRKRIELKVADELRTCSTCGTEKVCIGHEVSEVLNFVPASFEVLEYAREKLACKPCQEGVVIASAASKVADGGKCGPGLLAQVLVSKYADHCPLYRQHQIYLRSGVDLSENTLGSWVAWAALLLSPLARGIWQRLAAAEVLGGDGTTLRVLDADHENGSKRGHMCGYVAYDRNGIPTLAGFRYTPDWKKTGPGEFLKGFAGTLQCDAYKGWLSLAKNELRGLILAGCWAHARRKLVEALEGKAFSAAVPLKLVQKLYAVEAEAREHDAATRLALRQRDAVPIMADLKAWLTKHYGATRPSSPLGKAVEYLHNQWDMLQVYLSDGRVCIDNNWVENHLRPICVGKKNYLFAGSDEGAERAAVIYTVLANCKLAGVEPWAYLNDVLAELAQLRVGMKPEDVVAIERASHLGPHEWLAARRVVVPAN